MRDVTRISVQLLHEYEFSGPAYTSLKAEYYTICLLRLVIFNEFVKQDDIYSAGFTFPVLK